VNGGVRVRELSFTHHLEAPNQADYEENYRLHCGLPS
jgi:hypothetical protein